MRIFRTLQPDHDRAKCLLVKDCRVYPLPKCTGRKINNEPQTETNGAEVCVLGKCTLLGWRGLSRRETLVGKPGSAAVHGENVPAGVFSGKTNENRTPKRISIKAKCRNAEIWQLSQHGGRKFKGKWPKASAFGGGRAAKIPRFQRVKNCRGRWRERERKGRRTGAVHLLVMQRRKGKRRRELQGVVIYFLPQ